MDSSVEAANFFSHSVYDSWKINKLSCYAISRKGKAAKLKTCCKIALLPITTSGYCFNSGFFLFNSFSGWDTSYGTPLIISSVFFLSRARWGGIYV